MDELPYEAISVAPGVSMDWAHIRIEARRIVLRPVCINDVDSILHHFTPEITRYMVPKPAESRSEVEHYIHRSQASLISGLDLQIAVIAIDSEEFLGCCGLHKRAADEHPEVGIWIRTSAQGRGFGYEAVSAVLAWVKKHLAYTAAIYPVDERNTASRRLAEKLGGSVTGRYNMINASGRELGMLVYRIPLPDAANA